MIKNERGFPIYPRKALFRFCIFYFIIFSLSITSAPAIAAMMVMKIMVPTAIVGANTYTSTPTKMGKIEIFQCLVKYEAPNAPNSAGIT